MTHSGQMVANTHVVEGANPWPTPSLVGPPTARSVRGATVRGVAARQQSVCRPAAGGRRLARRPHRVEGRSAAPASPAVERTHERIGDVLQAMAADVASVSLQVQGCRTLQQLALRSSCDRDEIASRGGVAAVLKATEASPAFKEVQCAGVCALDKITACHQEATLSFMALGGVQVVVRSMSEHPSSSSLQEAGCRVLRNAAALSAECHAKVAALGGVRAVLGAMKAHPEAAPVQEAGCRALKELAAHCAVSKEGISCYGGIQVVLRAMETHRTLPSIQVYGCGVLRNMTASNAEHQESVVSRGGVPVVLEGMCKHPDSADVQWAGCWAIFCFAAGNAEMRAEVAAYGAVRTVLKAMDRHREEARVQEAGCWVLKELADQPAPGLAAAESPCGAPPPGLGQDRVAILAAGVQVVLKAMERHPSSAAVQAAAAGALRRLAANDAGAFVRTTCMGRCGRLGRSATMRALTSIKEGSGDEDDELQPSFMKKA
jgi:hypothetical protein